MYKVPKDKEDRKFYRKLSGILLVTGSMQFIIFMIISEAIDPGYSVSKNYISDLGVENSAVVFNSSIIFMGIAVVLSAYLMRHFIKDRLLMILFFCGGLFSAMVGIFTENAGYIHTLAALITFLSSSIAAVESYHIEKSPQSYISVTLGIISLIALVLYIGGVYGPLGQGGMERMIVYPVLLWLIVFGTYIMNCEL